MLDSRIVRGVVSFLQLYQTAALRKDLASSMPIGFTRNCLPTAHNRIQLLVALKKKPSSGKKGLYVPM